MDRTNRYADILTAVLRAEAAVSFRSYPRLRIVAACDRESGEFLLMMLGWVSDKEWRDSVLVHARLLDGLIVLETDNLEEGITPSFGGSGHSRRTYRFGY
jgi:hypothetical protein